jgi:replicative DNA helicase
MAASAAVAANDDEDEDQGLATSTYEFDDEFQSKIVALTLRDTVFVNRTDGLIDPSFLENDADGAIVKVALDHFKTYKKAPDRGSIGVILKDAIQSKKIRSDLVAEVKDRVKLALQQDISDRDFVIDEVGKFARYRAFEKALTDGVANWQRGRFEDVIRDVQKAGLVGTAEDIGEYDYFEEVEARTEHRIAVACGTIKPDGITTGYPDLDKELIHGGWGRKELSLYMGPAKSGKSIALWDHGAMASMAGYNVLGITLEVGKRIIGDRLDAKLSNTMMKVLKDKPNAVRDEIRKIKAKSGLLKIHEFASGTFKVSQLRRLIERYRTKGIIFDLIIVDYADLMMPERVQDELREASRQIYVDLRAVAFENNAAVLTATQTNRDGAKASIAKATDVAEDYNRIRTADIVITINATSAEKQIGEARLFFAASRNTEGEFVLRIQQDRAKMQFLTKFLGKESA